MKTQVPTVFTSPHLTILSESQLQALHLGALEILRRTGVRFFHRDALDMLHQAGASISDENLVKFPARLVEEAIASVPSRIVMCDRDGKPTVFLEGRRVNFGPGSDCIYFLDYETGEHRQFTQSDLIHGYHLCDALPNIDFLMSIGIPADVEPDLAYDVQMALMLEHTTKPVVFVTNDEATCKRAIDMAAAVASGHDTLREQQHILLYSEPSSPLRQSETAISKLLLMAEYELPVVHSPAAMMGGTAPITMASGLAVMLAEILSGLVVHQLKRRGAPFVLGAGLHHLDMKTMQIAHPSPEFELTKSVIAELGQWYGMPTWGYAGNSDAKVMDEQAALECMFSVTMAQLNGTNLVHDVGYMESALAACFEMIVLTDELIGMTDRFMQGIDVNDGTLMLDEVDQVGPGGSFLSTEGTMKHFREFWYPGLLDRTRRDNWLNAGGKTLGQRLNERLKEILATHQPKPLDPEKKKILQQILKEAARQKNHRLVGV
jgi:trimethylamine--corrinoid protein Co-methyltransferase